MGVCHTSKFLLLNLGLLFQPDRFMTYAKQAAARKLSVTMQHICAVIHTSAQGCLHQPLASIVFEFSRMDRDCITVHDMPQNGSSGLQLNFELDRDQCDNKEQVNIPVQLDSSRRDIIGTVQIMTKEKDNNIFVRRGVAIIVRNI